MTPNGQIPVALHIPSGSRDAVIDVPPHVPIVLSMANGARMTLLALPEAAGELPLAMAPQFRGRASSNQPEFLPVSTRFSGLGTDNEPWHTL